MILDETCDDLNKNKINKKLLENFRTMKMEIGFHLKDVGFIELKPNYLKSVKKVGLGKQFQVSGYFYVKQTSFL